MSDPGVIHGVMLKLYVQEHRRHHGKLLHEWIVEQARAMELPGASVFQAVAGYGHHGQMHRQSFLELQGDLPLQIEFALSTEQSQALLAKLREEKVALFWVSAPAQFGLLPGETGC
jgi:PII-like signaling protein